MYAIIGLGNPGKKYEKTRHNAGRIVCEEIARLLNLEKLHDSSSLSALISEGTIAGEKVVIALPETFMNLSGTTASALRRKSNPHFLIVHDDVDLPFGSLRVSYDRGAGGHRGVASVIEAIGTPEFGRVRIGVGRPIESTLPTDEFVLQPFSSDEYAGLVGLAPRVLDMIDMIIADGYEAAMNTFNTKGV